jgi:hypothetical protein
MSDASTAEPPRKRVRLATEPTPILRKSNYKPNTTSYGADPTLPPAISNLAKYYSTNYMKNAKQIHAKLLVLKKFDDDTYIPKSARLNFNLGVSEKVSKSEQFTNLVTTATTNKAAYESSQKTIIKQAAELEVNALVTNNKTLFCEALFKLTSLFYLKHLKSPDFEDKKVHELTTHVVKHNTCIIQYVFQKNDTKAFFDYYRSIYKEALSTDMIEDEIIADDNDDDAVYSQIDIDAEISQHYNRNASSTVSVSTTETNDNRIVKRTNNFPTNLIQQISTLIMRIFVHDWETYKNDYDEKIINAQMEKFATTTMAHKATDRAAAIVAAEPPATPQQLSELIDKAVNTKVTSLVREINSLKQQLSRSGNINNRNNSTIINKNNNNNNHNVPNKRNNKNVAKKQHRGETVTRASSKNKLKTNTPNKKRPPNANRSRQQSNGKPKVDDVEHGSSKGKPKSFVDNNSKKKSTNNNGMKNNRNTRNKRRN